MGLNQQALTIDSCTTYGLKICSFHISYIMFNRKNMLEKYPTKFFQFLVKKMFFTKRNKFKNMGRSFLIFTKEE